jgi:hypothetical protein
MARKLLVLVLCAFAPLAYAAAADAKLGAYGLFESGFDDFPVDAHSVRICWGGDEASQSDSWFIRRARGTTPPPADVPPEAQIPGGQEGVCYTANGLATDEPYTFRITGHDASGESEPGFVTVASRVSGTYVLNGGARERFPWPTGLLQLAVSPGDRRWHAIFPYSVNKIAGTYYSTRGKAGWTNPRFLATSVLSVIAASAGNVAVTWSDELSRYRPRYLLGSSGRFAPRRTIPLSSKRTMVGASVLDRRGHLHVLFIRETASGGTFYGSNASGRWRTQTIPALQPCDYGAWYLSCTSPPLIAYDSSTDRVVVLVQDHRIRVASKRAAAWKLGSFHALTAADERNLTATSLTSRANRITVGLESKTGRLPAEGVGPLYVMTNGRLLRVPGTTSDDFALQVAAASPDRVLLAWRRRSASWDRTRQGIWVAESVRDKRTGRWSIRGIQHRTASHYDFLTSLAVTAAGRPLISYTRG